jgi:transposase-like protein
MIQEVITYHCHQCNSENIEKNGTDYKGSQKYHCLDCKAYGTLKSEGRNYPPFFRDLVLRAYRERASMRGIERIFGIARQTLARWLEQEAAKFPDLVETLAPPQANYVLE